MSTSDFLFGSTAPSVWTSPTWTNTSSPEWWQAASQGLIGKASSIAGQDYQPYTGPRVAGLTGMQTDAAGMATDNAAGVNNTFDAANNNLTSAGNLFNQGDFSQFMSPYTSGVTDRIAELGARNLSENLLPAVNDTFTKAGQFGSSGNSDFTSRALRDTQDSILGQQATALESAQKDAMGNYQTAQQRQASTGAALGTLAGQESTTGINNANELNKFGLQQQQQDQTNLDTAYGDFQNQQNYPTQQLQMLNSIIRGFAPGNTSATSYSGTTPTTGTGSPLSNIAAALNSWNTSSPTS